MPSSASFETPYSVVGVVPPGSGAGDGSDGAVDRGRARVGQAGDPIEPLRDGLEDVDRARDVDPHPERRVRTHERHLERREVHDTGDGVLVERPLERLELGDVALARA